MSFFSKTDPQLTREEVERRLDGLREQEAIPTTATVVEPSSTSASANGIPPTYKPITSRPASASSPPPPSSTQTAPKTETGTNFSNATKASAPVEEEKKTVAKPQKRTQPQIDNTNEVNNLDNRFDLHHIGWTCAVYTAASVTFESLDSFGMAIVVFNPRIWFGLIIIATLMATMLRDLKGLRPFILYVAAAYTLLFILRILSHPA
jgi:hypothetical protein